MGAATSSTIFFRSIGSTLGVAAFGSMMLMRYHAEFVDAVSSRVPAGMTMYFSNPLLLMQMRPQIEASMAQGAAGHATLQELFAAVRTALEHGLERVFFWSAAIMVAAVVVHLALRNEPLRTRSVPADVPAH
jgi:hypothetical protein